MINIRYITITKTVMVLVVFSLLGWAKAGNASEQWDARTTARVNLRKHPRANAIILSIVPEGHKLRIMAQEGIWFKVDVEGKIHGKGWLHGDYVEKLIEVTGDKGSSIEKLWSETTMKDHRQGVNLAESLPTVRPGEETVEPPEQHYTGVPAIAAVNEGASETRAQRDKINEAGALPEVKTPAAREPSLPDVQVPPEVPEETDSAERMEKGPVEEIAENGLKDHTPVRYALPQKKDVAGASSKPENPVAGDPLHLASSQTAAESRVEDGGPKSLNASSTGKAPMPALWQPKSVLDKLQGTKHDPHVLSRPEAAGAEKPVHTPPVTAKAVADAPERMSPVKTMATPPEIIGSATRTESMGAGRIALKLLSIILSCSVILLLYLDNKRVVLKN